MRKTREEVLAIVAEMVAYARSLVEDVEFSAEDALRSDWAFLAQVPLPLFPHLWLTGARAAGVPPAAPLFRCATTSGRSHPSRSFLPRSPLPAVSCSHAPS